MRWTTRTSAWPCRFAQYDIRTGVARVYRNAEVYGNCQRRVDSDESEMRCTVGATANILICEPAQFLGAQMPGFGEKCVHLQPVSPRQGVAACRRPRQGRIPYAAIIVSAGVKNLSQPPSLLDRHNERHQYHCPRSLLRLRRIA